MASKVYTRAFIHEISEGDQVVVEITVKGAVVAKVSKIIKVIIPSRNGGKIGSHQLTVFEAKLPDGTLMNREEDILMRHEPEFGTFEKVYYDEVKKNDVLLYKSEKTGAKTIGKVVDIKIEQNADQEFKGHRFVGHLEKKIFIKTQHGSEIDEMTDTINSIFRQ